MKPGLKKNVLKIMLRYWTVAVRTVIVCIKWRPLLLRYKNKYHIIIRIENRIKSFLELHFAESRFVCRKFTTIKINIISRLKVI